MGWAARTNDGSRRALKTLRRLAATIVTRAQLERVLRTAPHPEAVRALLEPMLAPNLPCCAEWALTGELHTPSCPTRAIVITG